MFLLKLKIQKFNVHHYIGFYFSRLMVSDFNCIERFIKSGLNSILNLRCFEHLCIYSGLIFATKINKSVTLCCIFFALMVKVPGPLTEEIESKKAEKKKAQKAARKQREKEQKEEKLQKQQEEEEKRRFTALSDREKVTTFFLPLALYCSSLLRR